MNEHRVEVTVRHLGGARVVLLLFGPLADEDVAQAATDERTWRRFRASGFEERQRLVAERRERFRELLPMAVRLGVPVLTGSDVVGSIPREVAPLVECGLEPVDALRASTDTAMRFLGGDAADAPPSVVTFDADPRDDPRVLTRPAAIVIGGVRIR